MTDKQQLFVQEYLTCLNATEAAKLAGYSSKTAYSIGQRLLKSSDIQKAINEGMSSRKQRTELTQDYVLDNLREIITRCMDAKNFEARNAIRALELLGKHLGMFTDKLQLKEETAPVVFQWANKDSRQNAGD